MLQSGRQRLEIQGTTNEGSRGFDNLFVFRHRLQQEDREHAVRSSLRIPTDRTFGRPRVYSQDRYRGVVHLSLKVKAIFVLLCCVCAALPIAAQTAVPEGMVQISAGKFWIGRTQTFFLESVDIVARDRMDETPANNVYLDAFYIDKYEVVNADYARFVETKGIRPPWHWPQGKIPTGEEKFPAWNVNWF